MKISPEFETRLEGRKPDELVRAVVLLGAEPAPEGTGRRALRAKRAAMAAAAAARVAAAAAEIDPVLDEFGGRRLEGKLDILSGLAVETTAAGIRAMAELACVHAVMEDQGILSISEQYQPR